MSTTAALEPTSYNVEEPYNPLASDDEAPPKFLSDLGIKRHEWEQFLRRHRERMYPGDGERPPETPPEPHETRQVARLLTSLDTVETSGFGVGRSPSLEPLRPQQAAGFELWCHALTQAQEEAAALVSECGSVLWVALDDEGPCTIRTRCRQRICPACRNYRGYQVATACTNLMSQWNRTKFITLTRRPRDLSLRETIKTLIRDFNALRRTALWKASCSQGIYTVEIKRSPRREHWHVHLHILCNATYIPQAGLSAAWKHITKDSGIVHIRAAVESDAKYLAKYVAKGSEGECFPWEQWPYFNEVKGLRLCNTFGGAESIQALQPDPHHTLIAPLTVVTGWAMNGDMWAASILSMVANRLLPTEHGNDPPEKPPGRKSKVPDAPWLDN